MNIDRICVHGAGMMGHQIAQLAAMKGHTVSMVDIDRPAVQKGLDTIKRNLQGFYVAKGKMTQTEADSVFSRITGTPDLKEAVKGVQLVIETVPEVMGLKQREFEKLDEACAPDVILASNTSGMMITSLASVTRRPDKVVGMHFFNPVTMMKLIEVVRGMKTSDETINVIRDLSGKWGKETILVNDSPGFAVTRLYAVLLNEAVRLVQEGVCSVEDVDKGCALGLGHAMGPLRTIDLINGVGTLTHALEYLTDVLGDRFKPNLLLTKKTVAGEFGEWAGKGFYDWRQKK